MKMKMFAWQRRLILIALMVGPIVLASCSTTKVPSATSETEADKTKPYGSLTIASGGFGQGHVDPQITDVRSFRVLGGAILDSLLWYTPDGVLTGGIAERWEISPDGKTFTFRIRRGVKFHDGSDLTGADVKFSIERMLDKKVTNALAFDWQSATEGVELKDDYTVLVHLKVPQFELIRGMDDIMGAVVPKKYIEEKGEDYFRKNPIGSGPWKLTGMELGARADLEAVESHWRAVPKFKRLTLLNVAEEGSVIAQLKTGELDMAMVGPDSVASLEAAGVRIIGFDGGGRYWFVPWYDMDHPEKYALGDVRVRKALAIAINAKEMADKLFRGYGRSFALNAVSETAYFYDPNQIKIDTFDAEGARKLLAEAGHPSGFGTRLYDSGAGGLLSTVNQATVGYWRKLGVNADIVPMDFAVFQKMFKPKQVPELWNSIWSSQSNPPREFEVFLVAYHFRKGTQKMTNIPRLDDLIDLVPQTADPVKKKQLALEAAVLAKNNYSSGLPIVEVYTILGVSPKVGGVTLNRPIPAYLWAFSYETITHAK